MNLVILLVCSNGTFFQNQLLNRLLILRNHFLARRIFKIGSLDMFCTEPSFRFCKPLKFGDLIHGRNKYVFLWFEVDVESF